MTHAPQKTDPCVHVLLVEDDADHARLARAVLSSVPGQSYAVKGAGTVADALACLREHDFDAVLLDLLLPDSRGLETVARVREVVDRVPIVVMTATDDESLAIEAMKIGACDYLGADTIVAASCASPR